MRAYGLFFAAAAALAPAIAAAQPAEPAMGEAAAPSGRWQVRPRERHVFLRVEGGLSARLSDPFSFGALAPPSVLVQASFPFLHLGGFLLGPSLGVQGGIDANGAQGAVQPGVTLHRRFTERWAANARVDVPILITRGACPPPGALPVPVGRTDLQGMGVQGNRNSVPVPGTGYCPTVAVGVEAAVGGAFYLTSGFAITAEAIFDVYFGDGGLTYPLIGGGLGVLFDYEVLP